MKHPYGYWQKSVEELAITHDPSCANSSGGYIQIKKNGKTVLLHRWIWEQLAGPIPKNHEIDHENGIRTDCRLSNLRCVVKVGNMRNRAKPRNNTSGTTGVTRVEIKGTPYWVATYCDPLTSNQKLKYFSINKLGEELAEQSAKKFRAEKLAELQLNHGYTARHGH